jgi:hypothetical protein
MGLWVIAKAIKPAMEYAHQLNIMNMAGMKQKEIANAVGAAWKNTSTVLTTTATGNLRTILDLKNILGNISEATMVMPFVTKAQAVLSASKEGKLSANANDFAFSMVKALDMIGAVRNPAEFKMQSEMMEKSIIAFQGRIAPEMYKQVFQYARQARFGLGNEFKYEILPSLILEASTTGGGGGGGSRGVGPALAAMYRWTNQGYVNKLSVPELRSLGLMLPGAMLKTTTSGTTIGPMKDATLAHENPFRWVNEDVVPAIYKKYGNISDQQMIEHLGLLSRGNQLAGWLLTEMFYKRKNFLRDQAIIKGTMSTEEAYKSALSSDPTTAMAALTNQWTNFKTALTMGAAPVIVPTLIKLSEGFNLLGNTLRNHPYVANSLVAISTGLAGTLLIGGSVLLLSAGFKGLGILMDVVTLSKLPALTTALGKGGLLGGLLALIPIAYLLSEKFLHIGEWFWEKTHNPDGTPKSIFGKNSDLGGIEIETVRPGGNRGQALNNHIVLKVNEQVLGKTVAKSIATEADRPPTGTSFVDYLMTPQPVGVY